MKVFGDVMFARKLFIVAIILGISFLQTLQAETITEHN